MNKSPFEPIIDLLYGIINYSTNEMMMRLSGLGRDELVLQMPQFLIDRIPEAVQSKYGYFSPQYGSINSVAIFEGITINPSPDLAITLFHKNYPLLNQDWMIVKISLQPMQRRTGSWYDQYLISLQETPYFKGQTNPTNN